MDEIADLIRTLAERPASEPPLSRPKDLLEQRNIERAIQADPPDLAKRAADAEPALKVEAVQPAAAPAIPDYKQGPASQPQSKEKVQEAQADPQQRVTAAGPPASVVRNQQQALPSAGVMPAMRFIGKTATPSLMQAYYGVPAEVRDKGPVVVEAQASPTTKVQMVVPPAMPFNPEQMFNLADDAFRVPETTQPEVRQLGTILPLYLQSSEQLVADKFFAAEGSRQDLERFSL